MKPLIVVLFYNKAICGHFPLNPTRLHAHKRWTQCEHAVKGHNSYTSDKSVKTFAQHLVKTLVREVAGEEVRERGFNNAVEI